jgi:hypothetical protein
MSALFFGEYGMSEIRFTVTPRRAGGRQQWLVEEAGRGVVATFPSENAAVQHRRDLQSSGPDRPACVARSLGEATSSVRWRLDLPPYDHASL